MAGGTIDDATIRRKSLEAIRAQMIATIIPDLTPGGIATTGHVLLRLIDHLLALDAPDAPAAGQASETEVADLIVRDDAASRDAVRRFFDGEWDALVARDPEAAGGVIQMYLGGKTSRADEKGAPEAERPALTAASLQHYLRQRFPEQSEVEVVALDMLPGGMSKQTWRVRTSSGGQEKGFVIRKDMDRAALPLSSVDEYDMLAAMWATRRMPMAEPLWAERDPAIFGTPLMAVSLVAGSTDYSAAQQDPAAAEQFADALAGAMALLHSQPLQQTTAGPLVERSARDHVVAEIDRWHGFLKGGKVAPEPVLEGVFAWLRANVPAQQAPSAIVHGDIGFHNMLMHDGRLTALLDWEFTHVGDPAEDVVYARFFVEQVIAWERFLDMYERHGGVRPTAEQELFYSVWQSARNAAGCAGAEHMFLTADGVDPRLGVSGMTFKPRFALDALQRIVAA